MHFQVAPNENKFSEHFSPDRMCTEHMAISYTAGFKLNVIMYARENGNR